MSSVVWGDPVSWFGVQELALAACGQRVDHGADRLRRKLMQYIRAHNKTCQPIQWPYTNVKHRITASRTSVTPH
jgi:hypothetical protein